jgi:hypothetical protein
MKPGWEPVQLALPYIELVGELRDPAPGDAQTFRNGAKVLFPQSSVVPVPSAREYDAIIGCLYSGLRCGLTHSGMMQESNWKEAAIPLQADVQIGDGPIAVEYLRTSDDFVIQVGAKPFVDVVIAGLNALLYQRPYALTAVTQLRCVIDWMR